MTNFYMKFFSFYICGSVLFHKLSVFEISVTLQLDGSANADDLATTPESGSGRNKCKLFSLYLRY